MIDELAMQTGRYMLRQLPGLISRVETVFSEIRSPPSDDTERSVQMIAIDDASPFIQHMAALEGQLRVDACERGCICHMEVRAGVQATPGGGALASVVTAHDPLCPSLSFWKDPDDADEGDGAGTSEG